MNKLSLLLKNSFLRQKKLNSSLSLKVLASDVGVSSGYLSKVFSGQKGMTYDLIEKLSDRLRMDHLQIRQIKHEFKKSTLKKNLKKDISEDISESRGALKELSEMVLLAHDAEWLLEKWYRLPLLDLVTCSNFEENSAWIAKKMNLSSVDVEIDLKDLERFGFIKRDENNNLVKTHQKIRFPTQFSKNVIRMAHERQMQRAIQHMHGSTSQEDFDRRLITNVCVASNPKNIKKAQEILHRALYEASEILSQGECTDVYQINLQLFPHTK